jgi:hypothetical protein
MFVPVVIILLWFIYIIYTRITYDRFWIQQPVFHKFNISYYFSSPQIIQIEQPSKNKYTNFSNIETVCFDKLEDPLWNKFLSLIQNKTGDTKEKPDILPIFNSVLERSYISFYNEPVVFQNIEKGYYIDEKRPLGVITSRPLRMFIKQSNIDLEQPIYYIDFLHVNDNKNKQEQKNIKYELIQTHIYNQQLLNIHASKNSNANMQSGNNIMSKNDKNIRVCLFKLCNTSNNIGVVPLCLYKSYIFSLKQYYFKRAIGNSLTQSQNHFKHYQVFEVTKSTFHNVLDFIKEQHVDRYHVFILPNINNLFEQILSKSLIVYYLFDVINGRIISVYFFRVNKRTVTCVGSICYYDEVEKRNGRGNKNTEELFIYGFKLTLIKLTEKKAPPVMAQGKNKRDKSHTNAKSSEKEPYEFFCIENISDNFIIVNDLVKSSKNKSYLFYRTRDTMYFLYNYIHKQCDSKHVFILQ